MSLQEKEGGTQQCYLKLLGSHFTRVFIQVSLRIRFRRNHVRLSGCVSQPSPAARQGRNCSTESWHAWPNSHCKDELAPRSFLQPERQPAKGNPEPPARALGQPLLAVMFRTSTKRQSPESLRAGGCRIRTPSLTLLPNNTKRGRASGVTAGGPLLWQAGLCTRRQRRNCAGCR